MRLKLVGTTSAKSKSSKTKIKTTIDSGLSVFDDLNDHVLTHGAFKRTLVVIRLVGLNSREPHRDVAYGARRVFDSISINEVGYLH